MTRGEIRKALDDRNQKQAWLLDEVRKVGNIPGLTKQNLSKVICHTYEGSKTYADKVMAAIESVLNV